jgi:hypothetical protein
LCACITYKHYLRCVYEYRTGTPDTPNARYRYQPKLNINWQFTHWPQTAQDAPNAKYTAHAERAEPARCPTGARCGLPSDPLYVQAAWHGTIDVFGARVRGRNGEWDGRGGATGRDRDRTDKRGKCVRWGRKRKIPVVSLHHPSRAEWSAACVGWATGGRVRDGQPSSPFKKKKEKGICNSSLIKIIFRPIIHWPKRAREHLVSCPGKMLFLLSYATAPICPPFGPNQGKWRALNGYLTVLSAL